MHTGGLRHRISTLLRRALFAAPFLLVLLLDPANPAPCEAVFLDRETERRLVAALEPALAARMTPLGTERFRVTSPSSGSIEAEIAVSGAIRLDHRFAAVVSVDRPTRARADRFVDRIALFVPGTTFRLLASASVRAGSEFGLSGIGPGPNGSFYLELWGGYDAGGVEFLEWSLFTVSRDPALTRLLVHPLRYDPRRRDPKAKPVKSTVDAAFLTDSETVEILFDNDGPYPDWAGGSVERPCVEIYRVGPTSEQGERISVEEPDLALPGETVARGERGPPSSSRSPRTRRPPPARTRRGR